MRYKHLYRAIACTPIVLSICSPAYGYIDPGTGSLIIQGVLGAIAAIGVTMKIYWHKLVVLFSPRKKSTEVESEKNVIPSD